MKNLQNLVKRQAAASQAAGIDHNGQSTQSITTGKTIKRIKMDFEEFNNTSYYQIERVDNDDIYKYKLTIVPQEGMYVGGKWEFSFDCPLNYPNVPPTVHCLTPVYHPNIDKDGKVCLSILKVGDGGDWSAVCKFEHVAHGLLSLFVSPNPNDPLDVEAGSAMRANLEEFERTVKKTLRGGTFFGRHFPKLI